MIVEHARIMNVSWKFNISAYTQYPVSVADVHWNEQNVQLSIPWMYHAVYVILIHNACMEYITHANIIIVV